VVLNLAFEQKQPNNRSAPAEWSHRIHAASKVVTVTKT